MQIQKIQNTKCNEQTKKCLIKTKHKNKQF